MNLPQLDIARTFHLLVEFVCLFNWGAVPFTTALSLRSLTLGNSMYLPQQNRARARATPSDELQRGFSKLLKNSHKQMKRELDESEMQQHKEREIILLRK